MTTEDEKRIAAEASVEFVAGGMTVGLGTGSTVAYLLPALAARRLDIRCVATSPRTAQAATHLVAPDGWLIKGGGAAHTREKIVAAAADRFVVIADSTKPVAALHGSVPVELLAYGLSATLRELPPVVLRDVPRSPDGGVIGDYRCGELTDPAALAARLDAVPGVVDHGLFPPSMVSDVLIARGVDVEHRVI
jgi:ribose 5-phosphate isomerase A